MNANCTICIFGKWLTEEDVPELIRYVWCHCVCLVRRPSLIHVYGFLVTRGEVGFGIHLGAVVRLGALQGTRVSDLGVPSRWRWEGVRIANLDEKRGWW